MSRPPRRKPASSRTTTPRPRKIAGRAAGGRDVPATTEPDTDVPSHSVSDTDLTSAPGAADHVAVDDATEEDVADADVAEEDVAEADTSESADTDEAEDEPTGLASARLTNVLFSVLAVLLVAALVLLGTMVATKVWPQDDGGQAAEDVPEGEIAIPDGKPVVADELAWQEGVDAAAKAAQEIVAVNYETYDAEVESAAALMTEEFEATYRETAQDVRQDVLDRKVVQQVTIAAQGVVRANETELQALIFLNQFVTREDEDGKTNVITPYKVLVTMVHTDNGWYVDRLDTDDPTVATGE